MRVPCFALALATGLLAQPPILRHTFENSTEGWTGAGGASTALSKGQAKTGKAALAIVYSLDSTHVSPAILPTPNGALAELGRIRFWVRADHDTTVALLLSEKKPAGGDYCALFWCQASTWQLVDLVPADFSPNDGPTDPNDANHKLDLDQVSGIAILDLSRLFNKIADGAAPMVIDKAVGTHTLFLDDFEVLPAGKGDVTPPMRSGWFDAFDRGFLQWIALGGMKLQPVAANGNPLREPAMLASYRQSSDKFPLLLRRIWPELSGATRLMFDVASERDMTLVVSLEISEPGVQQGPRYQFLVYPPKDKEVFHVNVKLSDFEHDESSPADAAGTLDPARIKTIILGDITGVANGGESHLGANRMWIGKFEAIR